MPALSAFGFKLAAIPSTQKPMQLRPGVKTRGRRLRLMGIPETVMLRYSCEPVEVQEGLANYETYRMAPGKIP